jgi:photosystem II stability/assembly factor-like uncharacterized protein
MKLKRVSSWYRAAAIIHVIAMLAFTSNRTRCHAADELLSLGREEANLRSVTFIDADRGWAAGQFGTILHTQDGGVTWKPQATGSRANLTGIAMYNSQRGLAIGGMTQPYTQLSLGEVLVTMNGGTTWQVITGHDLPRLRQLLIGPGGKCVAIGDWSPVHLSSVFTSSDGGMNWQPQTCEMSGSAVGLAGTVDDYLVLSERGEVFRVRSDTAPQMILPINDDWRMLAGNDQKRMLVGPRGAITSLDCGDTWQLVSQPEAVPLSIHASHSGATMWWKDELWMATESSSVMTSVIADQIRTVSQPAEAPIRAVFRLDADRGWAVGDFGVVSVTRDGGATWRVVRGGGRSAAVMAISSQAESIPWSLIASESLQHQKRIAIVIDRDANILSASQREQLIDATSTLGPAITLTSRSTRDQIAEILSTCKPAVVLLDQTLSPPTRATWATCALEAGVKRVLEVGERGSQTVHVAAAIPSAGLLASDVWFDAVSFANPSYLPPSRLMLATRFDMAADSIAGEGLANCIGNDPRYGWSRMSTASRRQMQVLQARTAEMTWMDSLVASSQSADEFQKQWTAVLARMNETDRHRAFARLVSLAANRGRSDVYLAALETFTNPAEALGQSQPDASDALRSLAQVRMEGIMASAEWRHTFGNVARLANRSTDVTGRESATSATVDLAVHLSPFKSSASPPIGMSPSLQQVGGEFGEAQAKSLGIQLVGGNSTPKRESKPASPVAVDLRWEFHPAVLMANQMTERASLAEPSVAPSDAALLDGSANGDSSAAETSAANTPALVSLNDARSSAGTNLQRLARLTSAGPWGILAADSRLPETLLGTRATVQPHLDGRFDESWWQGGQVFINDTDTIRVQLAHDQQFLYVAIDAPALSTEKTGTKERQRDTPLDGVDRIRMRFDIDRDLMTAFEFEFDGNGNTRDSCDGFLPYHPKWFIACIEVDGRTRAELAIQKSDFGSASFDSQAIWNIAVDRLAKTKADRGLKLPTASDWRPVMWE